MKYFTLGADIFESEDEVKDYIKGFAEWEDVAIKMKKTYTREDPHTYRDYEEPMPDLTISEMEECFENYLDAIVEEIKMGEERFGFVYQEARYRLELWDSEASIENSSYLRVTDWAPIRMKKVPVSDDYKTFGYGITHSAENNLTSVNFTAYVMFTEEEWNLVKEQVKTSKRSLENVFRDKFNDYVEEAKFVISFDESKFTTSLDGGIDNDKVQNS